MSALNVCSFPTTHGQSGTLKLDAKGPDDPRGRSHEMFQNKMKMLPASKRGERLVSKKAKQQVKEIK